MSEVSPAPHLDDLIELFYADANQLGRFDGCSSDQCPDVYRQLLAHNAHMTVTVEKRHGEQVDVQVLRDQIQGNDYRREILLRKQSDSMVVQYGIVRLKLNLISGHVRDQILSRQIPLGRVLIQNNVLRQVQLGALWKVSCGSVLAEIFSVEEHTTTYGRTALIYLDAEPAIELLEIVAPEQ